MICQALLGVHLSALKGHPSSVPLLDIQVGFFDRHQGNTTLFGGFLLIVIVYRGPQDPILFMMTRDQAPEAAFR